MFIAKVVGHVVSTQKDPKLVGHKLLLVRPGLEIGGAGGKEIQFDTKCVATVDTVSAGVGETVLVATGQAARLAVEDPGVSVDCAIVGIIDTIDIF